MSQTRQSGFAQSNFNPQGSMSGTNNNNQVSTSQKIPSNNQGGLQQSQNKPNQAPSSFNPQASTNYNSGAFYQDQGYTSTGNQMNNKNSAQDKNTMYNYNQNVNQFPSQGMGSSGNFGYSSMSGDPYASQGYGYGKQMSSSKQPYQSNPLGIEPKQTMFACDESELDEIFSVFQRNGVANANELIEALRSSGLAASCGIVIDKINDWVANNRSTDVNEFQFKNFFKFNLEDESDFKFVFKLIDDQRGQSAGVRELSNANKKFEIELGLSADDMRLMIDNLKAGPHDIVSRQDLFNILYGRR